MVGNDEARINFDNASEASAFGAGTNGRIERKECRGGLSVDFSVYSGAESPGEGTQWFAFGIEYFDATFTKGEGIFQSLNRTGTVFRMKYDSILDDEEDRIFV